MKTAVENAVRTMRAQSPLVHSLTNFVVMEVTANTLLAAGASPLMAQAEEEMDDLLSIASALVLNIGTLDRYWIDSMEHAARAAAAHTVPVVLDPVGAGASRLRTETAVRLLKTARPAVLRGNASEIMAVAAGGRLAASRGVDSANESSEALETAKALARAHACVVSVSGETDYITDGTRTLAVHGGSPLLTRVTGMGCSATALSAALVAAAKDSLTGAAAAMAVMAEAGENAARHASGPGSFLPLFLDALYSLDPAKAAARVEEREKDPGKKDTLESA